MGIHDLTGQAGEALRRVRGQGPVVTITSRLTDANRPAGIPGGGVFSTPVQMSPAAALIAAPP
jgi:hypothetical protein